MARVGLFSERISKFYGMPYYEIAIGYHHKYILLRMAGLQRSVLKIPQANFFNKTHSAKYWVSWSDDIIAMGNSSEVGENVIFKYNDSSYEINYLGFTSYNTKLEWLYEAGE